MIIRLNTLLSSIFCLSIINPVAAHNIKTDAGVGATFHIEPNHNPRAGEPATAWFALTRAGGDSILLEQCNCKLTVRSQSPDIEASSLPQPPLKAVSAEQYQKIPGADIIFPKAGIYELEISGTPKENADFKPFKLSYNVTVLPGKMSAVESPIQNNLQSEQTDSTTSSTQHSQGFWIAIAFGAILASVSVWIIAKQIKSTKK